MTDLERPILFSGPMVRAILDGSKTQTRRVVKPQPEKRGDDGGYWIPVKAVRSMVNVRDTSGTIAEACPYGVPGTRLWVRETWRVFGGREYEYQQEPGSVVYRANDFTEKGDGWRPSIFMPRWASRITLEVTAVRVERLQDISHQDALKEGVWPQFCEGHLGPINTFERAWNRINGKGSWDQNPFVWVIEFRRMQ
jgi:hypothetical protein